MRIRLDEDAPTVLVVDDDQPTRKLFTELLRRAGFGVLDAADGESALTLVADEELSAVLLDSRMPGMGGLEVLARLREMPTGRMLPVIFVTGQDEIDDRIRGFDAGANDYLVKPVDAGELVARVRAQLRTRDAWVSSIDAMERRLDAVTLLRRVRRGESPEATAEMICGELCELDGVEGAGVLTFSGDRAVIPLAIEGALRAQFTSREPLRDVDASIMVRRTHSGPWLARPGDFGEESRGSGAEFDLSMVSLAVAPLHGGQRPLGALVLAAEPSHDAVTGGLLSSAIDYAAVVSALIAPELEAVELLDLVRAHLRGLVAAESFVPHFQPIVELQSGEAVGYEGLTRWHDGVRPDVRFAEGHAMGIGVELEFATLRVLLRESAALPPACWLGVNVSPTVVTSDGLGDLLAGVERDVVIEVTEHDRVDDYEALVSAARGLSNVRLSVDDAGAGYASMRHVLDLHPDLIKLDISWIRDIDTDRARQALVAGMANFAGELGCVLIAEGIETHPEHETLMELGVSLGQGYLFAHPTPIAAFTS